MSRFKFVLTVLALMLFARSAWADVPGLTVKKTPETSGVKYFDPKNPPPDMPPPEPPEAAECDSTFTSDANVGCTGQQTDATHATITINKIDVTIGLDILIWLPNKAPQYIVDHENGHKQISEYYYKNYLDKLAAKIAAPYMGKKYQITGPDFHASMAKQLDKIGTEITDEYNKELPVENTQQRYDKINNHSLNEKITAEESMKQALKETFPSTQPTTQASTRPAN